MCIDYCRGLFEAATFGVFIMNTTDIAISIAEISPRKWRCIFAIKKDDGSFIDIVATDARLEKAMHKCVNIYTAKKKAIDNAKE